MNKIFTKLFLMIIGAVLMVANANAIAPSNSCDIWDNPDLRKSNHPNSYLKTAEKELQENKAGLFPVSALGAYWKKEVLGRPKCKERFSLLTLEKQTDDGFFKHILEVNGKQYPSKVMRFVYLERNFLNGPALETHLPMKFSVIASRKDKPSSGAAQKAKSGKVVVSKSSEPTADSRVWKELEGVKKDIADINHMVGGDARLLPLLKEDMKRVQTKLAEISGLTEGFANLKDVVLLQQKQLDLLKIGGPDIEAKIDKINQSIDVLFGKHTEQISALQSETRALRGISEKHQDEIQTLREDFNRLGTSSNELSVVNSIVGKLDRTTISYIFIGAVVVLVWFLAYGSKRNDLLARLTRVEIDLNGGRNQEKGYGLMKKVSHLMEDCKIHFGLTSSMRTILESQIAWEHSVSINSLYKLPVGMNHMVMWGFVYNGNFYLVKFWRKADTPFGYICTSILRNPRQAHPNPADPVPIKDLLMVLLEAVAKGTLPPSQRSQRRQSNGG